MTKPVKSPIAVQKFLKGVDYPCSRDDLVRAAKENGAPQDVLDTIGQLPGDQFDSPADVMKGYGEERRS